MKQEDWISISDRQPSPDQRVLVRYLGWQDGKQVSVQSTATAALVRGRIHFWGIPGDITHWMPLPPDPGDEERDAD